MEIIDIPHDTCSNSKNDSHTEILRNVQEHILPIRVYPPCWGKGGGGGGRQVNPLEVYSGGSFSGEGTLVIFVFTLLNGDQLLKETVFFPFLPVRVDSILKGFHPPENRTGSQKFFTFVEIFCQAVLMRGQIMVTCRPTKNTITLLSLNTLPYNKL